MTLSDIEGLIARRDRGTEVSDEWSHLPEQTLIPYGSIMHSGLGDNIGVTVRSRQRNVAQREHSREDDDFVLMHLRKMRLQDKLHILPLENGLLVGEGPSVVQSTTPVNETACAGFVVEVQGNGAVIARTKIGFRKDFREDTEDLISTAAVAYDLAARFFRRKRFGPTAYLHVGLYNQDRNHRLITRLPIVQDLGKDIDLSLPFDANFVRFAERILRSGGSNPNPEAIRNQISDVWQRTFAAGSLQPWNDDRQST